MEASVKLVQVSVWGGSAATQCSGGHVNTVSPELDPQFVHGLFLCSVLCRWGLCALVNNMRTEVVWGPMLLASSMTRCFLQALSMGSKAHGLGDLVRKPYDARAPAGYRTHDLKLSTCARLAHCPRRLRHRLCTCAASSTASIAQWQSVSPVN